MLQRALAVFYRTFQLNFLGFGGRPPLRFFRFAWSFLKYSEPRFAISLPPFRPRLTAAGSFFFAKTRGKAFFCIMHDSALPPKGCQRRLKKSIEPVLNSGQRTQEPRFRFAFDEYEMTSQSAKLEDECSRSQRFRTKISLLLSLLCGNALALCDPSSHL
jgi:hypothetical protein